MGRPKAAKAAAACNAAHDLHRVDQVGRQIGADVNSTDGSKQGRLDIPAADDAAALSVCGGTYVVGSVVLHDGSYFAFDLAGLLIGEYLSLRDTMRAIPGRRA